MTGRDTATFESGDERVRRLREKPNLAEDVTASREEMREADRAHAMGLAALRRAADLTQTEIARSLGVSQAAIAKTEQRHDLLLSTLRAYLEAIGGHLRIIVAFDGGEVELDLRQLNATAEKERLAPA